MLKHALKNASIPVVTFIGILFVRLLAGMVAIETVFGWPGIGQLAYESVLSADFPVIQTIVLLVGSITVTVNMAIDILYGQLDPRIRYQ